MVEWLASFPVVAWRNAALVGGLLLQEDNEREDKVLMIHYHWFLLMKSAIGKAKLPQNKL